MKWLFLGVFGGVGGIALGLTAMGVYGSSQLVLHGEEVPGHVVGIDSDGDTSSPRFAYTDGRGVQHEATSSVSTSEPYEVGQRVRVLYPPDAPEDGCINDFQNLWLANAIGGGFGAVFFGAGLVSFFVIRSSDKTFGPHFKRGVHASVARAMKEKGTAVMLDTIITGITEEDDHFLVHCGRDNLTFEGEIAMHPGDVVGETVKVYMDPTKRDIYFVDVAPLLRRVL